MECEICLKWLHTKCVGIDTAEYSRLQHSSESWGCPDCFTSAFPFWNCSTVNSDDDKSISASPGCSAINSTPATDPSQNRALTPPRNSLVVYYTNCRSLLPKIDELRLLADDTRLDFIALTETWLDPSIKDSELSIPSFTLLRRDRSRHGGGVCPYVREGLTITSKWLHESAELLSISVQTTSELFLLSVLYRPPGLDLDLSELQVIMGSLNLPHHRHAILVGDFNVNLSVSPSTGGASNLLDLMEAFGLSQCLHQPTRVTSTCSSLIDHVYANHPNLVSALSVGSPLSTSDHLSVCLHLSVISKLAKSPMRELWFYNKADFESIAEILDSLLAGLPNPSTSGVDKAWSNFKSTFLRIISEMVPHKLVKTRKYLPWLTKAARHCMQMRDRAHREAKKFNMASLWEKFRSAKPDH